MKQNNIFQAVKSNAAYIVVDLRNQFFTSSLI